jgi:hypothetical protein
MNISSLSATPAPHPPIDLQICVWHVLAAVKNLFLVNKPLAIRIAGNRLANHAPPGARLSSSNHNRFSSRLSIQSELLSTAEPSAASPHCEIPAFGSSNSGAGVNFLSMTSTQFYTPGKAQGWSNVEPKISGCYCRGGVDVVGFG